MCTVLLAPGVNPIAVNKYIISYCTVRLDVGENVFKFVLFIFILLFI